MRNFMISLFSGIILGSIIAFFVTDGPIFFRIQAAPHYVENAALEINPDVFFMYFTIIIVAVIIIYASLFLLGRLRHKIRMVSNK
ncbi:MULTISPECIES: hypothetical protein [Bacillaceae]|uniref:DUF4321 domain-containing protein n=1 Tax=Evansella alkalicola TaxID=745819 RepID=A0ABS6JYI6_9BACI|nr:MULTISPECIES: hypothetical protein [Bacillaceae]MBU9723292.1 hypothetical protein [Bacillus alkalicola]